MKILNEKNTKNTQNQTDVTIGIVEEKDDDRKFKFKRPLMLKIFIPLSIIALTSLLICLLTLTDDYELIMDETSNIQEDHLKNVLSRNYNFRHKRQLETCEGCNIEEEREFQFLKSVLRCKKNLENHQDCCDLYKKVKELNKVMEDVKKEFDLLQVPCGLQNEVEGEKKKDSSSSSSSSSGKKEEKIKNSDENTAQEEFDQNQFLYDGDEENHQNIEYFQKNKEIEPVQFNENTFYKQIHQNPDIIIYQNQDDNKSGVQEDNMQNTTFNNTENFPVPSKDVNENNNNYDTNFRDTVPFKNDYNYEETYPNNYENPPVNIAQQTTQNIAEESINTPIFSSYDNPESTPDKNPQQEHNNYNYNDNIYQGNNFDYNNNPEQSYGRNRYIQNIPEYVTPQEKLVEEYAPIDQAQNKEKIIDNQDYDIDIHYKVKNDDYAAPYVDNIAETTVQNNFDHKDMNVDQTTSINEEIHNINEDYNKENYYDQQKEIYMPNIDYDTKNHQTTAKEIHNTNVDYNIDIYYDQQTTNKSTYNHLISQEEYTQNISEQNNKIENSTSTNSSLVEQYYDGNISVQYIENTTGSTTIQYENYSKNIEDKYSISKEEHTTIYIQNSTRNSPKEDSIFYDHFDDNYDINVKIKVNDETATTVKYHYENTYKEQNENYDNIHSNHEDGYAKNYEETTTNTKNEYDIYNKQFEENYDKVAYDNLDKYPITYTTQDNENHSNLQTSPEETYNASIKLTVQQTTENTSIKLTVQQTTENIEDYYANSNNYEEQYNNPNIYDNTDHYTDLLEQLRQLNATIYTDEGNAQNSKAIEAPSIVIQPTNLYEEDNTDNEKATDNNYDNDYTNKEKLNDEYGYNYNNEDTNKQQVNNAYDTAQHVNIEEYTVNNYNNEDLNNKEVNNYNPTEENGQQIYNTYNNGDVYKQQSVDEQEAPNEEYINIHVTIHEGNLYDTTTEVTQQYINNYQPENDNYYDVANIGSDSQYIMSTTEESTTLYKEYQNINLDYKENINNGDQQIYNPDNMENMYTKQYYDDEDAQNEHINIHIKIHEDNIYETTIESETTTIPSKYVEEKIPQLTDYYQPENNNYYDITNIDADPQNPSMTVEDQNINNQYNDNDDQFYKTYNNEDIYKHEPNNEQEAQNEENINIHVNLNEDIYVTVKSKSTTFPSKYSEETIPPQIDYYQPENNNYYDIANIEDGPQNPSKPTEESAFVKENQNINNEYYDNDDQFYKVYNNEDIYKQESNNEQEAQNEEDINIHVSLNDDNIYVTIKSKTTTAPSKYLEETIPPQIGYYQPENNNYDTANIEDDPQRSSVTTEESTFVKEDQNINNEYNINDEQFYNPYNNANIYNQESNNEQEAQNAEDISIHIMHEHNIYETTTYNIYNNEDPTENYYNNEKQIDNYYNNNKELNNYTEEHQNINIEKTKNDEQIYNADNNENFYKKQYYNGQIYNTDNIEDFYKQLYGGQQPQNETINEDNNNNEQIYNTDNNEDYYQQQYYDGQQAQNEDNTHEASKPIEQYTNYHQQENDNLYHMSNIESDSLHLRSTTEETKTFQKEHPPNYSPDYEHNPTNYDPKNENQDYEIDFRLKIEENSTSTTIRSYYEKEINNEYPDEMDLETIKNPGQKIKYDRNIADSNSEDYYTDSQGKIEELGQNEENILALETATYKKEINNQYNFYDETTTNQNQYDMVNSGYVNNKEINNFEETHYNEYPTTQISEINYGSDYNAQDNKFQYTEKTPYNESEAKLNEENVNEYTSNNPQIVKNKLEATHDQPDQTFQKGKTYNLEQDPYLKQNLETHEPDNFTAEENKTNTNNTEPNLQETNTNFFLPLEDSTNANSGFRGQIQPREQSTGDIRIVNQNPIAQRFQNTGSKFDNIFQLPPIETSKASQQLTVNTNMLPMCFYGFPGNSGPVLRQPGYDSQISPFSMTNTYGAFGYPQMFPNSIGQQSMYSYYNSLMGQQKLSQSNVFSQSPYNTNPYFCTYVPSSSLQFPPISGIQEFRNSDKKMAVPEDLDDKTIPKDWFPTLINSNKSRSSLHCLPHEKSCFDGIQCIKSNHWCDGIVQCNDKSDELGCPCKTRVDKTRLCDGYFDCPNGEDELGCFGCNAVEFSCDDWSERQKTATCVPLQERCDGIPQCKTGKDEMDCSLLTNSINVHQTYAVSKSSGYLHRNFKGNWYPVCSNTDSWALDACLAEVGPHTTFPLIQMLPIPNGYSGEFLTALPDKKIQFLKSCVNGEAIYVICPPIPCGTRLLPPPNQFRKHEVDTSAEEDFLPFVSRLRRFTDELHKINHHPSILSSNDFTDKKKHPTLENVHIVDITNDTEWSFEEQERLKRGENRVVGGKPSQPTSWPWVVAIYRDGIFHCGGVLMSELWVITAAHCIDTYWQHYYEIQAGMLRRFSFSPMEQNRVVAHIMGHQMYDRSDMKNDLALLKVSAPFQFNRWVRPVCLPSESSAGPEWMWGPQPGTICTAVGWGATIEHGPDPDHMREVEVPILPHCKHREDQEGEEICAGYLEGGRDACQGDSGGPLLCRNPLAPSQWYVAGIVSHGEGCARPNEPGAYTRVSKYLNWIARSILDENLPKRKPIQKCPGTLCIGTHRCIPKKRKCDKLVDCLVGDDEINCPKTDYSSLIKHAFDNMLLFATHNVTNNTDFVSNSNETNTDEQDEKEINNEKNNPENDNRNNNTFKNSEQSFINKTLPFEREIETNITDTVISEDVTESTNDQNTNTDRTSFTEEDIKIITQTFHQMNNENFLPANNRTHIPVYFECRKILQLIPMSRRCDKIIDCEDGTDEIRCSCRGYLHSSHPNAICDGVVDCYDGSDEANCLNCPASYFHCHLSQQCIPEALQCNHHPDCFFSEDEWDCFALTNDTYIRYDTDERPELRSKGVMSFSISGQWFPLCSNNWFQTAHDVAGDMCAYLGFSGFQKYLEIQIKQTSLQILSHNETSLTLRPANQTCRGLYVKCSTSLADTGDMKKIYTAHQSGANTFKELLMSPWNAAIFVDGVYTCSGTLIEKDWVITSRACLHIDLHRNYTTVVFGAGRGHMNVIGPHEQIRFISELVQILLTDVALLRLEKPVTFTRYVRPLYIRHIGNDIVSERETCTVLGKENDSFMQVVLKPHLTKCLRGKRCFKRVTPLGNCDVKHPPWGGTIVCLSETGWYPAAVYFDQKGPCGFLTTVEYTSIRGIKARIINAMNKHEFPIKPPICSGVRCPLGHCVSLEKLCDGIPDCRDGSDETEEVCEEKNKICKDSNNCDCAPSELRCHNSKCIPKSAFCDRVNDCGDWSDEPARCNCSSYLSLVAPHKLCDGMSNCLDKSDESPRVCGCRNDNYKCEKSEACIPNEWVCDGVPDCPNKEDEMVCLALRKPEGERDGAGEVVLRSFGVWHSYCMRGQVLSPPDLQDICRELGYSTAHAAAVNGSFTRPAQDIAEENFSLVRFNQFVMMFLKGDYPMAKLRKNDGCERLYIECTPP